MSVHVNLGSVPDIKTGTQGHLANTLKLRNHSEARAGLWQAWTSNVACASCRQSKREAGCSLISYYTVVELLATQHMHS